MGRKYNTVGKPEANGVEGQQQNKGGDGKDSFLKLFAREKPTAREQRCYDRAAAGRRSYDSATGIRGPRDSSAAFRTVREAEDDP